MRLTLIVVSLLTLAACHRGSAEVYGDGYRIRGDNYGHDDYHDHYGHEGRFCPPGQAKKGRC